LTLSTVNLVSKIPEVRTRQRSISCNSKRSTQTSNYAPQTLLCNCCIHKTWTCFLSAQHVCRLHSTINTN